MNQSVISKDLKDWHSCNCIGPRNGEPLCPCQMKGVKVVDGRYVKTVDLGPAPDRAKDIAARFPETFAILSGWGKGR